MALSALNAIPSFDLYAAQLIMSGDSSGLTADVFREANQSQNTSQSARAFSGASATNEMVDSAELLQDASALNSKSAMINAATGNSPSNNPGSRTAVVNIGGPQLAQAGTQLLQDQGIAQQAVASLMDAVGTPSVATNTLDQNEITQTALTAINNVDVDLPTHLVGDVPVLTVVVHGTNSAAGIQASELPKQTANPSVGQQPGPAIAALASQPQQAQGTVVAPPTQESRVHSPFLAVQLPNLTAFLQGSVSQGLTVKPFDLLSGVSDPQKSVASSFTYAPSIRPINIVA